MAVFTRKRLLGAVAVAVASVALLAGCSNDPLAEQYREGSNKNYISGTGVVKEIALENRGEAIDFEAQDFAGETVSSEDFRGEVLVVNFWYASCAPCRAEAPTLEAVNQQFAGQGASLLGVNVRDQVDTARAFEETYGVTYSSIADINDGSMQQAFGNEVPPNAVPTTLVLDQEGRVAARILGQIKDESILRTLVRDTIAEAE
ncbi:MULTISPECIES: TlpA family protein disulfide reductase [Microterricola]|uniref:Peroxiredoxin n=2 Tax=Microterricola TaxID=518733 RepID=A0A1H1MX15_9MICO|nr:MULTISPECIES: TlpA disulfide reductase family protein [Microterricola]PPL16325.1 alkyl hydroperoxide reductase [Microterricola pindariensis]SDR91254.1 Peroxiredoxin [Microterricola viridarii]